MGQRSRRQVLDWVDITAANDEHINFALCCSLRDFYVDKRRGQSQSNPMQFPVGAT